MAVPVSASTATPSGNAAADASKGRVTFLTLPVDIRLEIYDWVFYSTMLEVDQVEAFARTQAGESVGRSEDAGQGEDDARSPSEDDVQRETPAGAHDGDQSEYVDGHEDEPDRENLQTVDIYRPPTMTEQLNLVCRLLNAEIGRSWHSKVTYKFSCTVAFLDVLGQWPQHKIEALRHVYICAYPLPLYSVRDHSCYTTHFIGDALPIFPGLRLDVLTVENIWLEPDGEELDGWCLGATKCELFDLLLSSGWKRLEYLSGRLGLLQRQVRKIEDRVVDMKKQRSEDRYAYAIGDPRPRLTGLINVDRQGNSTEEDTAEDKAEVATYEAKHPEELAESPEEAKKAIQAWAVRGTDEYAQSGEERTAVIRGLLKHDSWIALRKTGEFLVDHGTEDPCVHL